MDILTFDLFSSIYSTFCESLFSFRCTDFLSVDFTFLVLLFFMSSGDKKS